MHRRAIALPALLVAVAIAIGACGGSTPALTDPAEILTKAVEALQKVKTVHLEATVDGTVKLDITGTGQAGDIALTGTKLAADVDVAGSNLKANLEVPAMLGMTADVIVVGGDSYVRTSLLGTKYTKSPTADAGLPVDGVDPAKSLAELQTWLKRPEVSPKKIDDKACGSKSCYQVQIDLSAAEMLSLIPGGADMGDAQVILTVLVEKDTLRPAGIVVKFGATAVGEVTLTLTMSKWDESLAITAPPASEVE